jgi:predicted hydrolase (HD superfamily)
VVGAILSHATWNLDEYPRDRPIRKALFAVDEICGFITATARVRPERISGLRAPSVVKKLKQKSFAAAVSREDVHEGAKLLELDLETHVNHCIDAMTGVAADLDLLPR